MFTAALRSMELIMTVGPVLTPPHSILLPIPAEMKGTWSWIEGPEGHRTISTRGANDADPPFAGKIDDRAHVTHDPPVIREGWLQVVKEPTK